ncbi:MAG TPA: helix-turn-helix transcriptional regulator [Bacteroidota bacterium]|nr:helix-turn-helix transcriptional regulator [Bacteroidota bacterium]
MNRSQAIAQRLKQFGQSKFGKERGWKKRFAGGLGISVQHLNRYLSGASEPGNKMYLRLVDLGCDIEWLLTGGSKEKISMRSQQDNELLNELKKAGISSVDQLRGLLNPEQLAEDIATSVVREIRSKYMPKRAKK